MAFADDHGHFDFYRFQMTPGFLVTTEKNTKNCAPVIDIETADLKDGFLIDTFYDDDSDPHLIMREFWVLPARGESFSYDYAGSSSIAIKDGYQMNIYFRDAFGARYLIAKKTLTAPNDGSEKPVVHYVGMDANDHVIEDCHYQSK